LGVGNCGTTAVNQVTGALTRNVFNGEFGQAYVATNLDLKGKFDTGPLNHSTLMGFDYYYMDAPVSPFIQGPATANALPSFNIYAPVYGSNLAGVKPNTFFVNSEGWKGVYAQDMISFWDNKVHLLLGGRYDWAEIEDQPILNNPLLADWTRVFQWSKAFSPRIGLTYQPLPWLSLYGNYTKSLSDNNGLTNGTPLPPITSYQYEGGMKAELLDKRLLLTLAYFDITKTNIPGPDPTNPTNTLIAGKAESKGVEFDLKGRINDNWSVIANYTHDDARVVSGSLYNPLTEITNEYFIAGNRLVSVPKDMGNLWLKYDADGPFKGLSAGGGVSIIGSSFGDNANSFVLPSYAIVNGMLAYRFALGPTHVTAQINVKNLLDTTYYAASQTRFQITPGTPRTVLGSLRVEF